jgi:hypothetical protein
VTTPPSKGLVVELYLIYFGLAQSFVDDHQVPHPPSRQLWPHPARPRPPPPHLPSRAIPLSCHPPAFRSPCTTLSSSPHPACTTDNSNLRLIVLFSLVIPFISSSFVYIIPDLDIPSSFSNADFQLFQSTLGEPVDGISQNPRIWVHVEPARSAFHHYAHYDFVRPSRTQKSP